MVVLHDTLKWVNETNFNDGKKQNSIFSMLVKCSHLLKKVLLNTDVKLFFCSELKQFLLFKTCKTNSVKVFQVSALQAVIVNQFHIFVLRKCFQFAGMQDTFWNETTENPYIWIGSYFQWKHALLFRETSCDINNQSHKATLSPLRKNWY